MLAQLANEPACARILSEQLRAHPPVFDHLRQLCGDALWQRIEAAQLGMPGACDQQIEIADQHVGREGIAYLIIGNDDAVALHAWPVRAEHDCHAILPGQHARNLAECRLEFEASSVARRVHRAHVAGAM